MTSPLMTSINYIKGMRKFFFVYICLILFYTLSIIGVQFIPRSAIEDNIRSSSEYLNDEGLNAIYGWNDFHHLDTFTDALIFDMIFVANPDEPINSGMLNYMYFNGGNPIDDLNYLANNNFDDIELGHYSRYWHGMQILIRPLLVLTDYEGIRIINFIFMTCLLAILCMLMWKRITPAFTLCFLLTFSVTNSFILPLCMQYCNCLNIAMIGMIALLLLPQTFHSYLNAGLLFFVIGSICNFFDLLTNPLISFGLPYIIYCVTQKLENPIKMLIILGLIWSIGYGISFISKWTIATIITNENCFIAALEAVQNRASSVITGKDDYTDLDLVYITKQLLYVLWVNFIWLSLGVMFIFIFLFFYNRRTFICNLRHHSWLLITAALVPTWYYFVMRNHSFVHLSLFAWRTLYLSIFSVLVFTYYMAKDGIHNKKYG